MLKFGREITYRPLLVGLAGILVGAFLAKSLGMAFGIITSVGLFIVAVFIYYGINLQLDFSYWTIDNNKIQYYDLSTFPKKVKTIFLTKHTGMETINLSDIKGYTFYGLGDAYKDIGWGIIVGIGQVVASRVLLRANNPRCLVIQTKDGKLITLDLARDYIADSKTMDKKLDQVIKILDKHKFD